MRCEIPRRSSTRASRTVSPSTTAAAGLKTALTGYGQSLGRQDRVGRDGGRRARGRAHAAATLARAARRSRRGRRRRRGGARRGGTRASTRRPRSRSAPRRRARRCSRRWRSRRAAAAGGCGRGTTRRRGVARTPCSGSRVTAKAVSSASTSAAASSGCSSPAARSGLAAPPAAVPGRRRKSPREAGLVAEPAQRLEPELDEIVAPECVAAADQRLREPRVVVAELVLEPAPVRPRRALVGLRELVDQTLEQVAAPPARAGRRRGGRARARRRRPCAARPRRRARRRAASSRSRAGSTTAGIHAVARISPSAQTERPTWSPTCGSSSQRRS